LISPPAPKLVAVGGLSGTGKSILARALAPHVMPSPGAVLLRSDVERKSLFGVGETDRLPAEAYSTDAGARVYAALNAKARRIIAAGHSVVVDAVFARPEERAAVGALSDRFHGLFLTADLATRVARVGARHGDASDADAGWRTNRRPMTSARSIGTESTRAARRRTRSSMPRMRLRDNAFRSPPADNAS
jgi:predicted kinase